MSMHVHIDGSHLSPEQADALADSLLERLGGTKENGPSTDAGAGDGDGDRRSADVAADEGIERLLEVSDRDASVLSEILLDLLEDLRVGLHRLDAVSGDVERQVARLKEEASNDTLVINVAYENGDAEPSVFAQKVCEALVEAQRDVRESLPLEVVDGRPDAQRALHDASPSAGAGETPSVGGDQAAPAGGAGAATLLDRGIAVRSGNAAGRWADCNVCGGRVWIDAVGQRDREHAISDLIRVHDQFMRQAPEDPEFLSLILSQADLIDEIRDLTAPTR